MPSINKEKKRKMLEKSALITSLLGILLLLIFSQQMDPAPKEISEITSKMLEEWVMVNGTITSIIEKEGLTILNLSDSKGSIAVVAYKNKARTAGLEKNLQVEVVGKVTEYYGKLEIEASKINRLNKESS